MFVQSIYPLINLVFVCSFVLTTTTNYPIQIKRHISHMPNCLRPFTVGADFHAQVLANLGYQKCKMYALFRFVG